MTVALDATLRGVPLEDVAAHAAGYEAAGFDGVYATETNSNPFLRIPLAAATTSRIALGTGIALAFPRSPMDVAYTAWDLQRLATGRFVLGLGSQVRAHVERRFSATWSKPAARMAEYIRAVRAIWLAWEDGSTLDFRGEFYSHTLMPPNFRPEPHGFRAPRIELAGVGERMVEVAGEQADGLLMHPLGTPRYVAESVLPGIERGLERAGRDRSDIQLSAAVFLSRTDEERETVRRRIAFYASTPAYRRVLDLYGWGELSERLHGLSRAGEWDRMTSLVDDEVLGTFALHAADPAEVAAEVTRRYDGVVDRVNLHGGARSDLEGWGPIAAALAERGSAVQPRPQV